jgi:hypothetical protein
MDKSTGPGIRPIGREIQARSGSEEPLRPGPQSDEPEGEKGAYKAAIQKVKEGLAEDFEIGEYLRGIHALAWPKPLVLDACLRLNFVGIYDNASIVDYVKRRWGVDVDPFVVDEVYNSRIYNDCVPIVCQRKSAQLLMRKLDLQREAVKQLREKIAAGEISEKTLASLIATIERHVQLELAHDVRDDTASLKARLKM